VPIEENGVRYGDERKSRKYTNYYYGYIVLPLYVGRWFVFEKY
jgi:hypothetical protein